MAAVTELVEGASILFPEGPRVVVANADRPAEWLPSWAATHRPRMKESSAPYAITWRWIRDAGALLDTSPAWESPPTRRQKAAYRQFAAAVEAHQATVIEAVGRQGDALAAIGRRVGSAACSAQPVGDGPSVARRG